MLTLRCTRTLLTRLRVRPVADAPASTTTLGDWYGTNFQVGQRRFAFFIDEHARLPVLLTGQELKRLPAALAERAAMVLRACGVPPQAVAAECARMSDVTFATTKSRSVLGSLNEFVFNARVILERDPQSSPLQVSLDLVDMPLIGPHGGDSASDVARRLLGGRATPSDGHTRALVVTNVGVHTAVCRPLGGGDPVSLRIRWGWDVVPGQILDVAPSLEWTEPAGRFLVGSIVSRRIDAAALGLEPLGLEDQGMWDPLEDEWGEDGEPIPDWARAAVAWGPRRSVEMDQVLPGVDWSDPDDDPIVRSVELKEAGYRQPAYEILMGLCAADLRCLDAHAHLGNLAWDMGAKYALPHYEVGVRLGEYALGDDFDGVLLWGWIDNRPFLRCLYGYALSLWRLERFDEAVAAFERILWLNPPDNQGVRFVIERVRQCRPWTRDV